MSAPTPIEKSEKLGELFRLGEVGSSDGRAMLEVLSRFRRTLVVMPGVVLPPVQEVAG